MTTVWVIFSDTFLPGEDADGCGHRPWRWQRREEVALRGIKPAGWCLLRFATSALTIFTQKGSYLALFQTPRDKGRLDGRATTMISVVNQWTPVTTGCSLPGVGEEQVKFRGESGVRAEPWDQVLYGLTGARILKWDPLCQVHPKPL